MDITAAIIIFLFVATVFSSSGSKSKSGFQQTETIPSLTVQQNTSENIPGSLFADSGLQDPLPAVDAQVRKYGKNISPDEATFIAENIVKYSEKNNINPKLLTALYQRESRFNPGAVSPNGARGLGQLIPSTAENLGVNDCFDIEQNIDGSSKYFKTLLDKWRGDPKQIQLALASYLQGYGNIKRSGGEINKDAQIYINDILNITNSIR